jgi:hypothetical protein
VASGNSNAGATWNGGTVPGPDDDVHADGFTITVNANWTVLSLTTMQRSGGTAGGEFVLSAGVTVNATGGGVIAGTTSCVRFTQLAGNTATLNANVFGGPSNNALGAQCTQPGTLIINGNIEGGGGNNSHGVQCSNGGNTTINGNATAGSNSSARAVNNNGVGSVIINGIAIATNNSEAINNASTGTFTIAATRHAPNGRAPWTGNGRIFFSNLDLAHVTVNNAAHVQRMLGRRMLAPLGSFEGGFHG